MVKIEQRQDRLVVFLEGELTFYNSSDIKEQIKRAITGNEEQLILEFSGLTMIDSSGVGIIISLLKKMNGKDLIVVAPPPKIARVLEITRIDQIVPIASTLDEAYQK